MSSGEHFQPSAAFEEIKRRQDKLTYVPGFIFSLLILGSIMIGEWFGRVPAAIVFVPVLLGLVVWWILLARASVRTWRVLAAEQREWKARLARSSARSSEKRGM